MNKKPYIRKENSITYRRPMWYCRGSGSLGIAATPKDAYWDWRCRVLEKEEVAKKIEKFYDYH